MAVHLSNELPAAVYLQNKKMPVSFDSVKRANKILVLNLMPQVEATETGLLEKLALSDVDAHITFMRTESHTFKRVPPEHYAKYYKTFSQCKDEYYDGFILTGCPTPPNSSALFWEEYREIDNWARTHVKTEFHICWSAFASVNQRYNVEFTPYDYYYFGIYPTKINIQDPIFDSLDENFLSFADRPGGLDRDRILEQEKNGLLMLAEYEGEGAAMMREKDRDVFYSLCHFDYIATELDAEYKAFCEANKKVHIPDNYYKNDDEKAGINKAAMANSLLLFDNWLWKYVDGNNYGAKKKEAQKLAAQKLEAEKSAAEKKEEKA